MSEAEIATGVVHEVPEDLTAVFKQDPTLLTLWNALTPLARNEWICWVTYVKKSETRQKHLLQLAEQILQGQKRPCCWPGCPHRRESAKKWFKQP